MELTVYDRQYDRWAFHVNNIPVGSSLNPLTAKLFHGDVINTEGIIIDSLYRQKQEIPGILIIEGNTYGRLNDKLLYKCIPNDKALPCFLIPYEYKVNNFNKKKYNKYITFKIIGWQDKHPIGQLTNAIGDVTDTEGFYQYQLRCKGLNQSINTFTKETLYNLKLINRENIGKELSKNLSDKPEDRRLLSIFSIDPAGCKDIDDAIGLQVVDEETIISIYIANVALVLDYLNLWSHFSERVATIYLPDGKTPMLPNILADDLCSLIQEKERCAFCLDIHLNKQNEVIHITFKPVLIRVQKNYVYEEDSLLLNTDYLRLFTLTKRLAMKYPYVESIKDSHDIVEFYMIFMNYESSKRLLQQQTGIFRSAQIVTEEGPGTAIINPDIRKFLRSYNVTNCNYCTSDKVLPHDLIGQGLPSYVHMTSPIRRLVDLINLIEIQGENMSENAKMFSSNWLTKIDYINKNMKAIKKVQNNCNLLALYLREPKGNYTAFLFNKTEELKQTIVIYKFSVYIPALKMVSTIKTTLILNNYTTVVVSGHLFMTEDNIMKKIRLQIV